MPYVTINGNGSRICCRAFIPWAKEFKRLHPQLKLTIDVEWMHADLIKENYDIAFRSHPISGPNLTLHPLTPIRGRLYASPGYIATHGQPLQPQDLSTHDCVIPVPRDLPTPLTLTLSNGHQQVAVQVHGGSINVNDPYAAVELACQGLGIVSWCKSVPQPATENGQLVRVLLDWHLEVPFLPLQRRARCPRAPKRFSISSTRSCVF